MSDTIEPADDVDGHAFRMKVAGAGSTADDGDDVAGHAARGRV